MPSKRSEKIHVDGNSIDYAIEGSTQQQVPWGRCLHMQQNQHDWYGKVPAIKATNTYLFRIVCIP